MAIDLRMIISSLQIATCLERCGDYGRNLAKRSDLGLSKIPELMSGMQRLGEAAILSLHNCLDAHATGNVELAKQICNSDTEIDKIYLSIFSKLTNEIIDADDKKATRIAQMFLAAKNIERIGDQSTNIAELIIFAQTGEVIEDSRVKIDESAL
jgi:phosphate transport system protein